MGFFSLFKKKKVNDADKTINNAQQTKAKVKTNDVIAETATDSTSVNTEKNTTNTAAKTIEKKSSSNTVQKEKAEKVSAAKSDTKKSDTQVKSAKKEVVATPNEEIVKDTAEVKTENEQPTNSKSTGRFEIKKSKDGRYVFNLFASNHVIVATSQVYSSAQSALVGIKSVIANADKAPIEDQTLKSYETYTYPKWEIYLDKGEQFRFKLLASNGSCVCHSQGYTSKNNCKKGIESIIKSSRNAEIDKSYLKKEDNK